jgi:lipoprotein-anchoring transpeptidase ErfK/SrfK
MLRVRIGPTLTTPEETMSSPVRSLVALFFLALGAMPVYAQSPADSAVRVVVNIPAGRLDLYRGAARVRSYPVSVGTPAHRTPAGSYEIRHAVWNPDWTPPPSAWAREKKHTAPGPRNPMAASSCLWATCTTSTAPSRRTSGCWARRPRTGASA